MSRHKVEFSFNTVQRVHIHPAGGLFFCLVLSTVQYNRIRIRLHTTDLAVTLRAETTYPTSLSTVQIVSSPNRVKLVIWTAF